MQRQKKGTQHKALKIAVVIAAALILVGLTAALIPQVLRLQDAETREQFRSFLDSLGIWGWVLALLMQVAQVVIAVIPGEPIEVIMGVLYGTWFGLATCLLGVAIGSILIFTLVRRFGEKFISRFVSLDELGKYRFLQNETRLDLFVFILFFIPGTPKDVLTYVVPLTKVRLSHFLALSMIARIPSVVTSTFAGSALGEGNLWVTILVFAITGLIGVGGILVNNKLLNRMNKDKQP